MNSSLHFFTVPALAAGDAQDEINLFLQQNRVVAVEKQWVADGAASYWSLCVTVVNGPGPLPANLRMTAGLAPSPAGGHARCNALPAGLPRSPHPNPRTGGMCIYTSLRQVGFAPSPLWGEGWGEGLCDTGPVRLNGPHPCPLPQAGEGAKPFRPHLAKHPLCTSPVQAKTNPKRGSRRVVDQPRAERAFGPAQPQRAWQAQQQPGVPVCSELNGRCGVDSPGHGPNRRPVARATRHGLKLQGPRGAGRQQPNAPRAAVLDCRTHG